MCDLIDNEPVSANIAIVEDESVLANRIKNGIISSYPSNCEVNCKIARSTGEFDSLLENHAFDAFSIDWEIDDYFAGAQILDRINEVAPDSATIVFTKHRDRLGEALKCGADDSLFKETDLKFYMHQMKSAVKMGLVRQIIRELTSLKRDISQVPAGLRMDRNTELSIFRMSRNAAIECKLHNNVSGKLVNLLSRRNWWKTFVSDTYIRLSFSDKVKYFIDLIGIDMADLAVMVGEAESKHLFNELEQRHNHRLNAKLYDLLYVFGSVFKLAGYEPELMPIYWMSTAETLSVLSTAPWGENGLNEYLKLFSVAGIQSSTQWLRGQQNV